MQFIAILLPVLVFGIISCQENNNPMAVDSTLDSEWAFYKETFNKIYPTDVEELARRLVFESNFRNIESHNKRYATGDVAFTLHVSQKADMTSDEFQGNLPAGHEIQINSSNAEWNIFKQRFQKSYNSSAEEQKRRAIFADNFRQIQMHNRKYATGRTSFSMAINQFSDLRFDEMKMAIVIPPMFNSTVAAASLFANATELPEFVDWRRENIVTSVKNQGDCGSCWAFSAVGAIEGQHAKVNGKLVSLSPQNLVDCSTANYGCSGGWPAASFEYVIKNNGIDTDSSYPYKGRQGRCRFSNRNVGATVSSYKTLPFGNEQELQKAVATIGPVSVAMHASEKFMSYRGGIFDDDTCLNKPVNHAMLAVGYGKDAAGKKYWIVKNSWGTGWGMEGYILMSRDAMNQCSIASFSSYPEVAKRREVDINARFWVN